MTSLIDIFANFLSLMRNDISEYYQRSSSYLKDLVIYKKIDLKRKIEGESDKQIKSSLAKILKAIKTGLNTLGISMDRLNGYQSNFLELLEGEKSKLIDYNSFFEIYMSEYGNEALFVVLLEYLFDIDTRKLENVNLFDLLPDNFISKLNEFKNSQINSDEIEQNFQQFDYKKHINFTELTIIKPEPQSKSDILNQLRVAKQDIIETLKTPKKEFSKQSITSLKEESLFIASPTLEKVSIDKTSNVTSNNQLKSLSATISSEQKELREMTNSGTFLDTIGQSIPISNEIINKFKIDMVNLVNLKMINKEFFNLENLFYYLSIIKMLNLEFPFTEAEILNIVKKHMNNKIFSSAKDNPPDLQNIFYGLAIFSELNLLNNTDQIDLIEVEKFLKSELEPFIPEKLESNLATLLGLNLLARKRTIKFNKDSIIRIISSFNILKLENVKLPLDIYNHLAFLKLLDKDFSLEQFKFNYLNEIKKLISPNGSIKDLITDSAHGLLILNLLDLKIYEPELYNNLLNYIFDKTTYFNADNFEGDFNWRIDKLGFSLELEMLYWVLLAGSQ